jgi:LPS O-antigen subunit length determinant protein (WzzB/FepE family)
MPASDYTPTLEQVAALIRARTRDSGGQETGTFSADTEPTADEVNDVIAQALSDVEDDIGSDIPEPALDGAKRLAALRTAMLVELTFFPEQLEAGTNNQYDRLKTLYDEKLKSVERAVAQAEEGEEIGAVDEPQWPAYGGFGPVSGWDDRKF